MTHTRLSRLLSRTLALALTVCLAAPAAGADDGAAERTPARFGEQPASGRTQAAVAGVPHKPADQRSPQPLSAEEIEELSKRAEEPGPEVVGGALSNLHLTYIVIALAAAVVVLIAK